MANSVDFESGQLAFICGKHSNDCPYKLPERREQWHKGFRDAMEKQHIDAKPRNTKAAIANISNLRKLLSA